MYFGILVGFRIQEVQFVITLEVGKKYTEKVVGLKEGEVLIKSKTDTIQWTMDSTDFYSWFVDHPILVTIWQIVEDEEYTK